MSERHELGSSGANQPLEEPHQNDTHTNSHNKQHTIHTEDDKSHLGRRMSAPARYKPIVGRDSLDQLDLNENQFIKCKKYNRFRHSQGDRSGRQEATSCIGQHNGLLVSHHHHHHHHHHHQHKSVSPLSGSSSSASDSAFSRSRSTLGSSDGEQSTTTNCFTTNSSLKRSQTHISEAEKHKNDDDHHHHHHRHSNSNLSSTYNQEDDHFQIIWRDLSYKVPQKRINRLSNCLRERFSHKPKVAAQVELNGQQNNHPDNQSTTVDNQSIDCSSNADVGQLEDEPQAISRLSVSSSKQRQVIFSNLNGCVRSGQLTAILGPSGAGKTTFLKCLTSTIEKGVSGSIDITGGSATSQQLKLCIIPQKDYLFDNLTVMENLLFASRIKNTKSDIDHKENVLRVAGLLGLQACLKLKTSRLSGGQYKRVSIAQELLSQPDILILDEPTSGLDSLTCFKTVSVLRDLVNMSQAGLLAPLAIVMTIHQPQIKIFNLFHHVYILSSMGHCIYEGSPEYVIDTVAERCNILPPPDDQNPASFIIDIGSEVYGSKPIDSLVKLQQENFHLIHSCSNNNSIDDTNNNHGDQIIEMGDKLDENPKALDKLACSGLKTCHASKKGDKSSDDDDCSIQAPGKFRISERLKKRNNHEHSFWLHTGLLVNRLWISMWRDSLLATTRISFHIIIPFVFYFVYSQKSGSANACPHVEREVDIQEMVSDANIQRLITQHDELILTFENVSLFFLLLYSFSMCVLAVTALSFPLNMQILLKETSNGWYTMPRFVMAKTLADLPVELTMPVISVSIAYAITGQPSSYLSWRMLTVTAVMTLCSLISQTQGLLFGAYFMNNVQAAVFVSQASTLPWILLSGFTTRVSELPKILQWLSFGSIYRLGIESIVAVRYGFGMCPCDRELVNDTPPKMIGIPDQLKSVMKYYLDMYSEAPPTTTTSSPSSSIISTSQTIDRQLEANSSTGPDIFEKIATTMSRANTYGVDIATCDDVRPFIMSAREVDETTLPMFMLILVSVLICLKILLFFVVRIRTG